MSLTNNLISTLNGCGLESKTWRDNKIIKTSGYENPETTYVHSLNPKDIGQYIASMQFTYQPKQDKLLPESYGLACDILLCFLVSYYAISKLTRNNLSDLKFKRKLK